MNYPKYNVRYIKNGYNKKEYCIQMNINFASVKSKTVLFLISDCAHLKINPPYCIAFSEELMGTLTVYMKQIWKQEDKFVRTKKYSWKLKKSIVKFVLNKHRQIAHAYTENPWQNWPTLICRYVISMWTYIYVDIGIQIKRFGRRFYRRSSR